MPASSIIAATIVFTGLILHVQTDNASNAKRAVFADARPSHRPVLIVQDSRRDGEHSGNWTFEQLGSRRRYDLSGMRLRVVGPNGIVKETDQFKNYVVRLPTVLTGGDALASPVREDAPPPPMVAATYLDYSGGTLDVPVCYRSAAHYVGVAGGPRCVAREVHFATDHAGTWEIQDADDPSRKIRFKENAIVQIQNETFPPTRGQHQKHYSQLLNQRTPVADLIESDLMCTPQCELIGIAASRGASVECTNNQWP